jgi:hypothetical protein
MNNMKKIVALFIIASISFASVSASPPSIQEKAKFESVNDFSMQNIVILVAEPAYLGRAIVFSLMQQEDVILVDVSDVKHPDPTAIQEIALQNEKRRQSLLVSVGDLQRNLLTDPDERQLYPKPINTAVTTYKGFNQLPPLRIRSAI